MARGAATGRYPLPTTHYPLPTREEDGTVAIRIHAAPPADHASGPAEAIHLELDDATFTLTRDEAQDVLERVQHALNALWLLRWDRAH